MNFQACGRKRIDKIITVAENSRKFSLNNPQALPVFQVVVDNCLITEGKRCDYLFEIDDPIRQVFYVELKGKAIEKACEQLKVTITVCKNRHQKLSKECHVVASRVPKLGTGMQVLKKKFRQQTGLNLNLHTRQATILIEKKG